MKRIVLAVASCFIVAALCSFAGCAAPQTSNDGEQAGATDFADAPSDLPSSNEASTNADDDDSAGDAESASAPTVLQSQLTLVEPTGGAVWDTSYEGPYYYNCAALIENADTAHDFENVVLIVTGKDSNGAVVCEERQVVPFIAAGDTMPYVNSFGDGSWMYTVQAVVESYDVSPSRYSGQQRDELYSLENTYAYIHGEDSYPHYDGDLTIDGGMFEDFDKVKICVTLYGDYGAVLLAGYDEVIDAPAAGEPVRFEVRGPNTVQLDSWRIDAIPWR